MIHVLFHADGGVLQMAKKKPNLRVRLATCSHCGRKARRRVGESANQPGCSRCRSERRGKASKAFGDREFTRADVRGGYLVP